MALGKSASVFYTLANKTLLPSISKSLAVTKSNTCCEPLTVPGDDAVINPKPSSWAEPLSIPEFEEVRNPKPSS